MNRRSPAFGNRFLVMTSLALASIASTTIAAPATAPTSPIEVRADHADTLYAVGETARWIVHVDAGVVGPIHYDVKRGQRDSVASGVLKPKDGVADVAATLDAAGTLLLEVTAADASGKTIRALGGAGFSIDKIKPSADAPDDFDRFWAAKIEMLRAIPMNVQIEPTPSTQPIEPTIEYHKFTLDNIWNTEIHGQLARPASGKKFPALLIVQWAGVYPLEQSWVLDRAREGWLALNILPHDLPIDQPAEFYKQQFEGPLKNYWQIGNDDREKSYYLRMYLSCVRAADYLASRPDWDGRTLVVMGTSQGGMQSLMLAGIHPKITACLALVPAGCDLLGEDVGRRSGWPQWVSEQSGGKDPAKVREAARYFDVTQFARRIKVPTLVGVGMIDETCPAAGVIATYNQIDAPKQLVVLPLSDHQGASGFFQRPFDDLRWKVWLPALKHGQSPPIGK